MTLLKEACSHRRPSCLHLDAGQGTGCGKILVISGESFMTPLKKGASRVAAEAKGGMIGYR